MRELEKEERRKIIAWTRNIKQLVEELFMLTPLAVNGGQQARGLIDSIPTMLDEALYEIGVEGVEVEEET